MINRDAPHWVYIAAMGGECRPSKIGITNDLEKRERALQNGNPHTVTIMWSIAKGTRQEALQVERELHRQFAPFRMNGEWFDLSCDQIVGLEPIA